MEERKTESIQIDRDLSRNLSIIASYKQKRKKDLVKEILSEGLKPHLKELDEHRFS